ncbi:MAG: lysophospholipid acyltransferase family protein [Candidatus Riflebacteria bacterium]|nr:lysophospholipid acyltransferase family protein [Candidatus Riflebacteria bacterium]
MRAPVAERHAFVSGVVDTRWDEPGYVSRVSLKGRAAAVFIRVLGSSLRLERVGWENNARALATGRPVVYVCWHGSQLAPTYAFRDRGIWIMTSLSRDGDIQTQSLNCLGYRTVRGSSSRGGSRALLEMVRRLRRGEATSMTLDGPRGPRHVAKPGAVLLAQRAGAVVLAVGARYGRAWQLHNWDRFEIPLPFSRVAVVTSEPFTLPPDLPVEEGTRRLADRLGECEAQADRRLDA